MPRKDLVVAVEDQNIISDLLLEDFDFDPKYLRRFYVNNLFQRTLAHLIGTSTVGAKKLVCTAAGILKVAPIGSGFEYNESKNGNATNAYGGIQTFTATASRVDIWITVNPATVKRSLDGVAFQDEILLQANTFYSFDAATAGFDIKNTTPGSNATYQVIGWW